MDLPSLLYLAIGLYLALSLIIFYAMINNIFFFRSSNYRIDIEGSRVTSKRLENPSIQYHLVEPETSTPNVKWVVMFHSWGRNSARMTSRADIYFKKGYSILLVDAPSHGKSQWVPIVYGMDYAKYAVQICQREGIREPIAHGLSFGSISALFFGRTYPTKALVLEALFADFPEMYAGFFRVLKIPKILFWWIPWIILNFTVDWDKYSPQQILPEFDRPILLIHGEQDIMFPVEHHFVKNKNLLSEKPHTYFHIVPDSPHSHMARYPGYADIIYNYLDEIEAI